MYMHLSVKDTQNKGHLSNEDTVCCSNHIEQCTNLPLNKDHLSIQDSQLGPSGVLYTEVPLYVHMYILYLWMCTYIRTYIHMYMYVGLIFTLGIGVCTSTKYLHSCTPT